MELAGLDPATATLAVELQLADVHAILGGLEAKQDVYAAFEVMRVGCQEVLLLLRDRVLAMNMVRADNESEVVLQTLAQEERQAAEDHSLARQLGGLAPERPDSIGLEECSARQDPCSAVDDCLVSYSPITTTRLEDHVITKADEFQSTFFLDVVHADTSTGTTATSSTAQLPKGKRKAVDTVEGDEHITHTICAACMERYARFDVLELGCKQQGDVTDHAYCRNCLIDLFRASLTDITLFPPRCCGVRIPIAECRHLCPPELVKQYQDKQLELALPNPVYCSNRSCAQFIKPEHVTADIATCPTCKVETCTLCKNPTHRGLCPEDPTVQMLMEVAGKKRWQRCHKCRTMVELLVGCYHMRCPCGGEFCYLCAKPWKTCSCSQWDERRLLSNDQGVDTPGNQIAMPEEEELPEADPSLDVLNDLQLRVATVAGGFAIGNDEEESDNESGSSIGACLHKWEQVYGVRGEFEACGICHQHLRYLQDATAQGAFK